MAAPLLSVDDLTVQFRGDSGWSTAVEGVSFDIAIASASLENRKSGATGPKVSSRAILMSIVASLSTVGS